LQLVIPAFSLAGPLATLGRRHKDRRDLSRKLNDEIRQLARTLGYQQQAGAVEQITSLIARSMIEEQERLDSVLAEVLASAEVIPLNASILMEAARYRLQLSISSQDSIVYASVMHQLGEEAPSESCFLNKNVKDFSSPDILDSLEARNCKTLFRFSDGLAYIKSRIGQ
jgi:hypothetical protein